MTLNMKVETMTKLHTFEIPTVIKHGIGAVHYVGNEAKTLGITKSASCHRPRDLQRRCGKSCCRITAKSRHSSYPLSKKWNLIPLYV